MSAFSLTRLKLQGLQSSTKDTVSIHTCINTHYTHLSAQTQCLFSLNLNVIWTFVFYLHCSVHRPLGLVLNLHRHGNISQEVVLRVAHTMADKKGQCLLVLGGEDCLSAVIVCETEIRMGRCRHIETAWREVCVSLGVVFNRRLTDFTFSII